MEISQSTTNYNIKYSIVVPVYNEADSLIELYQELVNVLFTLEGAYEIIFVDDGSNDISLDIIMNLAEKDEHVRVIAFNNNYGKSAAYTAAFKISRGELIFTLDSDLQDMPTEMPRLLEGISMGYDVVIGWKQKRINNEPLKKVPSFFYNWLKRKLFHLELHDSNSGFRCMKRNVVMGLKLYGDRYRFIPELSHLQGFKVTELPTEHRSRKFGKSKYGGARFITGLLDLLSVRYLSFYSSKPLHFFGTISFTSIIVGGLVEFYVLINKLSGSSFQIHIAALIIGVLFITMGFIFLSIGLLAEMITSHKADSNYSIKITK